MKKLDIYIIKKFLGTFFLSIAIIITIAVIFDFTEKLDNFIDTHAPARAIAFDYYLNFIPYFSNMFSPLFTFISVIFFTSKIAYNTEIIAILAGGVSFRRFLRPYMISATIIAMISFVLSSYIIPNSNKIRLDFEDKYLRGKKVVKDSNVHIEVSPGVFVYISYFNAATKKGQNMTLEHFKEGKLVSKISATGIRYNEEAKKWTLSNCVKRDINNLQEKITRYESIDTALAIYPEDFMYYKNYYETLTSGQLQKFIDKQAERGVGNVEEFRVEKYRRFASPFSVFILTIIGVSISSKKVRGGTGLHIGLGLLLSFSYILFSQVSNTFAINGDMNPILAVWIPNLMYAVIALVLYIKAPK